MEKGVIYVPSCWVGWSCSQPGSALGLRTAEQGFSSHPLAPSEAQSALCQYFPYRPGFLLFRGEERLNSRLSVQPSTQALLSEEDKPAFRGLVTPASADAGARRGACPTMTAGDGPLSSFPLAGAARKHILAGRQCLCLGSGHFFFF